jgi:hypothetical protein
MIRYSVQHYKVAFEGHAILQGFNIVSYFFPVVISKSPHKGKLEIVKHGAATKVELLSPCASRATVLMRHMFPFYSFVKAGGVSNFCHEKRPRRSSTYFPSRPSSLQEKKVTRPSSSFEGFRSYTGEEATSLQYILSL